MTWLKHEWAILWSTHRHWGIALLGLVGSLVDQNVFHGAALRDVQIGIGVATALGIRVVNNLPSVPPPAPDEGGQISVLELCALVIVLILFLAFFRVTLR